MAKTVNTNTFISLAGTDYSSQAQKVEVKEAMANVPVTNFGSGGFEEPIPGLGNGTVAVDWVFNDDGVLQDVLYTAHRARTPLAIVCRQSSAGVSLANPQYAGNIYIFEIVPIMGAVGEAKKQSVTYTFAGAPVRTTS